MTPTNTFTLPSGHVCVHRWLTGAEQQILTSKNGSMTDKINSILKNIVVSVGGDGDITDKLLDKLLAADRQAIMWMAQRFTYDFEDTIKLKIKYEGEFEIREGDEVKKYKDITVDEEIPLHDSPFTAYPVDMSSTPYMEINTEREFTLPKTGELIRYNLLDGAGERIMAADKDTSYLTSMKGRRPRRVTTSKSGNEVPISLDLARLNIRDVEALRADMEANEGKVDTIVTFGHPHAELVEPRYREKMVNIMAEPGFFFPSQA